MLNVLSVEKQYMPEENFCMQQYYVKDAMLIMQLKIGLMLENILGSH